MAQLGHPANLNCPTNMKLFRHGIAALVFATVMFAQDLTVYRAGSQPTQPGPSENFTGSVRVERLFGAAEPARATGGVVHFEARARTAWHAHPFGQTLIVTSGVGRVQNWGGPVQEIRPGDVVRIPPNVKHWHGASAGSGMSHVAITEQSQGQLVEWMEKVSDTEFTAPSAQQSTTSAPPAPIRAPQSIREIAPKLADLTDNVLFADVWARPQLARRDRSLVTVSALIAMNRPDQLRSHLALAKQNGVTEQELVEAITHLAFYAGWPSAMSAANVAREVFRTP